MVTTLDNLALTRKQARQFGAAASGHQVQAIGNAIRPDGKHLTLSHRLRISALPHARP